MVSQQRTVQGWALGTWQPRAAAGLASEGSLSLARPQSTALASSPSIGPSGLDRDKVSLHNCYELSEHSSFWTWERCGGGRKLSKVRSRQGRRRVQTDQAEEEEGPQPRPSLSFPTLRSNRWGTGLP
jgi:hypothetical protein